MYLKCLPANGHELLNRLIRIVKTHHAVLAGGTALSFHLGHRVSEDLDFFTGKPFSSGKLLRMIERLGFPLKLQHRGRGTLVAVVNDVKMSLFQYPYLFLDEKSELRGIPIAGIMDIASMKVMAIYQRGKKRDFVDLYFILKDCPFRKIADNTVRRFGANKVSPIDIGKSMVFFDDAESDPDPRYSSDERPSWQSIKKFFIGNMQQMVYDLRTSLAASPSGE